MCLYNESELKMAYEDIIVYKCMVFHNSGILTSPIQNRDKQYTLNKKYEAKKFHYSIDSGFYSFYNICDAYEYLEVLKNRRKIHKIVKCIIPKLSYYIHGYQSSMSAIRSKQIIFKEVLN